jgi:putative membrane protein insertion efficiency factor
MSAATEPRPPLWRARPLRALAILPIRLYQLVLSPMLGARCRYYPSCSQYAVQAIERYGILRGLVLAGWRLLRCNPWSPGGVDLIDDQRLFKPRGTSLHR